MVSAVVPPLTVKVPALLLTMKLLKASLVAVPLIFCAAVPLKLTVPLLCVNVAVLARVKLPDRFSVPEVDVNVPALSRLMLSLPLMLMVP